MKRIFLSLLLLAVPALAQQPHPPVQGAAQPHTIVDFKKEIGLSDKQAKELQTLIAGFQQKLMRERVQLQADQLMFQRYANEHADLSVIKAKLFDMEQSRIELRMQDIEVAEKMQSLMTKPQLAKWKALQERMQKGHQTMAAPSAPKGKGGK